MREYFVISTDVICNYWQGHNDKAIREVTAEFLRMSDKWKDTTELYKDFLSRRDDAEKERILSQLPDRDKWEKENFCTGNCCRKMVSQLKEEHDEIHDDAFNWNDYYFFNENNIHIAVPTMGVILNQSVKVDINRESHEEFFRVFFSFILSKTENPETFLKSHLEETFNNDSKKYKRFLVLAQAKHPEYLTRLENSINLWIEDESTKEVIRTDAPKTDQAKYFENAFIDNIGYKYIIESLSNNENKWFDNKGNFIRTGRGNGQDNPSATGTLLALLIERGFLSEKFKPWKNKTKSEFILKAFGVTVGESSTNLKTNPTQLERLNFIKFRKNLR